MTDILAVAEHRRGDLRDVSYELVTAGRQLADETGGELHLAVISGTVEDFAEKLNREGVDAIHTVTDGEEFNHDIYTQTVTQLADALDPQYVLIPNSVNGLDYAPAVGANLERPLITDTIALTTEGQTLTATREMYGGKVETTTELEGPAVVTIRSAEWPKAEGTSDATIESFEPEIDEGAIRSTVTGFEEVGSGDVDISDAEVLVSVGRGIDEEENLEIIHELADALDATVSSSRPIVDNGWLPKNRQVGQSGKVVTPDVYIAIGISGAVQHVAGMKGSDTIVAINTDPNAPIMDIADYAITDDLFDVVPALTEAFQ
ncbi:electron transfer flavoprotein subunit alpha/FixB family protein [Natronolimnobius sp. AArcel1]|uniref:electron transfer flavoprotein subunit alpha/FixB family protein n=1 Tax=Natronolimnobius sp. AArcel1 TaxID=1679093 RepID=UPI0013EB0B23|nr:electron transfer flavoprotein subunit alpha/FixB family protein [Natronolimnobius sp. AArcel1]NGM70228.1 electron transfer flavoprotein subunit alpha/FixB family protein [Natronolimnobius sp. AArcel1]